jgi:hypothetical protein
MNFVELVARKLRAITIANGGIDRGIGENGWQDYVDNARELIAGIGEPTREMLEAAAAIDVSRKIEVGGKEYWQAMITAALNEG